MRNLEAGANQDLPASYTAPCRRSSWLAPPRGIHTIMAFRDNTLGRKDVLLPASIPSQDLSMPKVTFVTEKRDIDVPAGSNLREEARKAGIEVYWGPYVYLNCRGNGLCGKCRVLVKKGAENLSSPTTIERFRLATGMENIGQEEEMRLSCQARVNGDCTIQTKPPFNWSGDNFWQKPYPNK